MELIVEFDPKLADEECWSAVVRCVTDISKGDHLTVATPYVVEFDEKMTTATQIKAPSFPVDLIVVRIISWEKEWDTASPGMAATVFFEGDASEVKARTFLSSATAAQ